MRGSELIAVAAGGPVGRSLLLVGTVGALFGLIAGLVACYRGLMISGGGAKAVGNAVNETVVYAFMALFVINVVVTAVGIRMTTG